MRPAHKDNQRRTFGWFESRLVSHFEAALKLEHPNLILRTLPFAEAKSDSQLLFVFLKVGKVYLCEFFSTRTGKRTIARL